MKKALSDLRAAKSGLVSRSAQISVTEVPVYETISESEYLTRMAASSTDFVLSDSEFPEDRVMDPGSNRDEKNKRRRGKGRDTDKDGVGGEIDKLIMAQGTRGAMDALNGKGRKGVDSKAAVDSLLGDLLALAEQDVASVVQTSTSTAKGRKKERDSTSVFAEKYVQLPPVKNVVDSPGPASGSICKESKSSVFSPKVNEATTEMEEHTSQLVAKVPFAKSTPLLKKESIISTPVKAVEMPLIHSPLVASQEGRFASLSYDFKVAFSGEEKSDDAAAAFNLLDAAPLDQTDTIQLYWIDIYEDPVNQPGILFLFGKVLDPASKLFISCAVMIKNLERCLFILPRQQRWENPDDPSSATDIPVSIADVHEEMTEVFEKMRIDRVRMKPVKRSYAFDKLAEGVPKEGEYLKVKYGAKFPTLPLDFKGQTFSHVFGVRSTLTELLLVKRQIMGPCWLEISNLEKSKTKFSFCRVEFVLESMKHVERQKVEIVDHSGNSFEKEENVVVKHIKRLEQIVEPPNLVCMALHIQSMLQTKTHTREIVAISAVVHRGVNIDGPTPNQTKIEIFSAVRKIGADLLPVDLSAVLKKSPVGGYHTEICPTEAALLNFFMAKLMQIDPDCIICHGCHGFQFDILLNRFDALNIQNPQRIGRLSKRTLVNRVKKGGKQSMHFHSNADVAAGRILCDTEVSCKELLREKNYSLSEICRTQLNTMYREIEADKTSRYFTDAQNISVLLAECTQAAYLTMQLTFKLMILPLTKQLTEVCGNLWSRSLQSQRSERNEFLLLHKFHAKKFICPDKLTFADRKLITDKKKQVLLAGKSLPKLAKTAKKKDAGLVTSANITAPEDTELKAQLEELESELEISNEADIIGDADDGDEDDDDNAESGRKRRKPAYSGGLVLEPKRGFYDKYVLLLDFNSLYPSIIQEYNLCFTTVQHYSISKKAIPNIPSPDAEVGILPTVLKFLVERRRAIKGLLKREKDEIKQQQLEIKQKAFKLVANSMYGSLGFPTSRFCCKPIAALITAQGRDILQKTVDLIQGPLSLNVIYGDTDSVFVYTGSIDLQEVRTIGQQIKQSINKLYKLLEIELDGVFKSLLLLRKKKYAALKLVDINAIESADKALETLIETKGLDMVRRDWCQLSKDISKDVLDEILSGLPEEDVVQNIQRHLQKLGDAVRNNQIPIGKFIISKQLTKDPKDYTDAKSQPHVQVALSMIQVGKQVKSGDTVPYIVCKFMDEQQHGTIASRSHHPDTVLSSNGKILIDQEWYLSVQILPPVLRLCEPIKGTDRALLAECLGLDSKRFVASTNSLANEVLDDLHTTYRIEDDEERFKDCQPFQISCPNCGLLISLPGVLYRGLDWKKLASSHGTEVNQEQDYFSGLRCPKKGCRGFSSLPIHSSEDPTYLCKAYVTSKVLFFIRSLIQKFYTSPYVCNDLICATSTSIISLRRSTTGAQGKLAHIDPSSRPCSVTGCTGRMIPQFSAQQLDTQLHYLSCIFDIERQTKRLASELAHREKNASSSRKDRSALLQAEADKIITNIMTPMERELCVAIHAQVEKFRLTSAYNFVDLGELFGHLSFKVK